ncbi:RNA polymerase sigma factor [Confluentibacter sediminis]|uniref:RNA polymerase sigma factor n=1 Tax=Confluentibacter sediminis TaxID=2219045 RepID=UPI0013A6F406|nr:sigma-70 family RNA polymerase sigma factor [Confluentibacter sediminis]
MKSLYTSNYNKIELLVLRNSGTKEDAKDIYQDAFIAVWNNIKNNTFIPVNERAVQGYLYTIAKNKWMDILKSSRFKKTQYGFSNPSLVDKSDYVEDVTDKNLENEKLVSTMEAFKILGQPCKELLTIFYFEKKSLRDIAIQLQIDEASARNKKYRCMEKLRNMVIAPK